MRCRTQALWLLLLLAHTPFASAQPFVYAAPQYSQVFVLNAANSLSQVARIDLPSTQWATDLALGSQDRRLYVTTMRAPFSGGPPYNGSLVVIDTLTNTIVRTVTFPEAAWAVTVSADGQRIYVSREPAVVTILRASDFANIGEVPVGIQPQHLALMPDESALYVANYASANVSVIDLTTFTATTIPVGTNPAYVAIRPDGREAYVAHNSNAHSLTVIDAASRTVSATIVVPPVGSQSTQDQGPFPAALAFSNDGAKLFVGDGTNGLYGTTYPVRVMNTSTRTFTASGLSTAVSDVAVDRAAQRAYFFGSNGMMLVNSVSSLDMTSDARVASSTASMATGGRGAVAVGNPAGCAFEISPKLAFFGPGGGAGNITVPAPDGCSWTVTTATQWISAGVTSGSGAGTVTYTVAANAGEPRSGAITIAGQTLQVKQTVPQIWIDEPVNGSTANQPVVLRGWAIDRDDTQTEDRYGTGVDAVNVYAYPVGGGAATFLGTATRQPRADISAAYGFKYAWSGFTLNVRGLPAGTYTLVAYAHSARTGSFTAASVTVTLTTNSMPAGFVEAPRPNDEVTQPFLLAGWAVDLARASGTGVDAVNVYAYPASGGAPAFVGSARYGSWPRPDIANYYGDSSLTHSGYLMLVSGLAVGRYTLVVYAHSTVTGQFFARTVDVNVIGNSEAIMQVDLATPNSTNMVSLIGWAADRRASTGNGIAALHVWAYPDSGGAPMFLGSTGSPTVERLEARLVLGDQFANSGWYFLSPTLASGSYRIVVYALSTVTGQFDAVRVVRVVIP